MTRFRLFVNLGVVCFLALQGTVPAWGDDETPFPLPRYLIHITETSTISGPRRRDDYILSSQAPQGGILVEPDGEGGTFTSRAEIVGGPFNSKAEACRFAEGNARILQALGCEHAPAANHGRRGLVEKIRDGVGDFWSGLSTGGKIFVVLLGIGACWYFLGGAAAAGGVAATEAVGAAEGASATAFTAWMDEALTRAGLAAAKEAAKQALKKMGRAYGEQEIKAYMAELFRKHAAAAGLTAARVAGWDAARIGRLFDQFGL